MGSGARRPEGVGQLMEDIAPAVGAPRVLWLARTLPLPLNAGDRIYTAAIAEALARAGARVTYLGLANPDEAMGSRAALSAAVDWVEVPGAPTGRARALLSARPLVARRFDTPAYRVRLAAALERLRPDVVVLDQYALVWALPLVRRARPRPLLVHVAHDAETEVTREIARATRGNPVRRALLAQNALKTARAEAALLRGCDALVTLTEHDGDVLGRLDPSVARLVVPPGYGWAPRAPRVITHAVPRQVVILGSYHWVAKQMNLVDFLRRGGPALAQAGIGCRVVGAAPEEALRRWRAEFPAVEFLGFVEDVQPVLDDARLGLVVETTGGGFKLKMLDYLFRRVPMAGIEGALRGLPDDVACHVLAAPDAARLADGVVARIDDVDALQAMQVAAFEAARDRFDWSRNGDRLLAFLRGLLARPPGAAS